jgi:hypothetical protein
MFSGVKGVNTQVLLKYEWATGKEWKETEGFLM